MSPGSEPRAKLLLKARPTPAQLADRLRPPLPDGLELYLDSDDLADAKAMEDIQARWASLDLPDDFAVTVEGPMRSLDGQFFSVGRQAAADTRLVERLAEFSHCLGARAVNIHVIAPNPAASLTPDARRETLERSLPLIRLFAEHVVERGMVPTVENMPPVLRMREGGYYFSPVGMHPEDLLWLVERVPGLRICLDISHAQLLVNAAAQAGADGADPQFPELMTFLRAMPAPASVLQFLANVRTHVETVHISNARGLLGEGHPYGEGDLNLDSLIPELARAAHYLVTETLEAEADKAVRMREALERMRQALATRSSA